MKIIKQLITYLVALALATQPAFGQTHANGTCMLMPGSQKCIDSTPCKQAPTGETVCLSGIKGPFGSINVPQTCWQFGYSFACQDQSASVNTCDPYEKNKSCSLIASTCSTTNPTSGACVQYDYTYQCQTKPAETSEQTVCSNGLFQPAAFATPQNPNKTFSQAAIASELIRETATYSKNGTGIFGGVAETCRQGYGGIKDCCKSASGAKSNAVMTNLVLSAGGSAVKYAGSVAVDAASPYVYDMMFEYGKYKDDFDMMLMASEGTTNMAANGPSFSAYGFTYNSTAPEVLEGGNGLMGADTEIATFEGGGNLTFNPYVFGAMVAIAVYQSLKSCDASEQMLSMHRGANLSVFIKKECTNDVPLLGCLEYTSTYCSFNSVLAKTVNVQGKPQLGKSINDCGGISVEDLGKIDFSKIDFSEFSADIAAQAQKNIPTNMSGNYTPIMTNTTSGSAQTKNPALPKY